MTSATDTPLYTYKATVMRWVDGDTVWLRVDLGFRLWMEEDFRLFGIDTPEHNKPGGTEATTFSKAMAPEGTQVILKSYKDPDKYGRWLADVFVGNDSVNTALIASGNAVSYFGGKKTLLPVSIATLTEDGKIIEEREEPTL